MNYSPMNPAAAGSDRSGLYSHVQMVQVDPDLLEREGTAELKNDPRFFTENVIDRRLAAFEAMAIVTELMSAEAVKQCFELSAEYLRVGPYSFAAVMQAVGLFLMCSVMLMSTIATAVLSLQLFFTLRLMTAGPTGFDKAARFYQDKRMWLWREWAIAGIKYCVVTFMLSTGFMLWVKFFVEGAPAVEEESERGKVSEYHTHQWIAWGLLVFFLCGSGILAYLVRQHQRVFNESYATLDNCHNEMNRHLTSDRQGVASPGGGGFW